MYVGGSQNRHDDDQSITYLKKQGLPNGTTFLVRIPNLRMPNVRPSLVRISTYFQMFDTLYVRQVGS
jgi:hypothetical protein